jgi:hypothetical protein
LFLIDINYLRQIASISINRKPDHPAKDGTELRSEIRPKTEMKISETEVQPGELLLQYRGEKNPSKIRQD